MLHQTKQSESEILQTENCPTDFAAHGKLRCKRENKMKQNDPTDDRKSSEFKEWVQ